MDILAQLDQEEAARVLGEKKIPEFRPGDTVIVNVKVKEGDRTRVQAYEGVCIARSGGGFQESFTVRKISYGEGVERVFPVYSPNIESIKVVRKGKVRRAKLYYCAIAAASRPASPSASSPATRANRPSGFPRQSGGLRVAFFVAGNVISLSLSVFPSPALASRPENNTGRE